MLFFWQRGDRFVAAVEAVVSTMVPVTSTVNR